MTRRLHALNTVLDAAMNWKNMPDGREKRAAYLCSREWNVLREQVRQRSRGTCERCRSKPAENCHHLTYARLYAELLTDLMDVCRPCHEFISGKIDLDPCKEVAAYMAMARPVPESWGGDNSVTTNTSGGPCSLITCPECGCLNCHMGAPAASGPERGNQGTVVIPMSCEANHEWDLVIVGHKGFLTAYIENLRDILMEDGDDA